MLYTAPMSYPISGPRLPYSIASCGVTVADRKQKGKNPPSSKDTTEGTCKSSS